VLIQAVIEPSDEAREHLAGALMRHLPRYDVSWFVPADWRIRLATFGYLAFGDMTKVEETMSAQVSKLPSMTLRMNRIVPLPEDSDDSIWVELDGDLDELATLAQEIPGWVHGLGYMLDRYSFRPRIRLARVSSRTTLRYLEQIIGDVGDYIGPEWTAEAVQIARRKPDGTPGALYRTHASMPLGTALHPAETRGSTMTRSGGGSAEIPPSRFPLPRDTAPKREA
jgi:2'-5' RNA ligase